MGYPYDKTYLEKIQANTQECRQIRDAYYVLRDKYLKEHPEYDEISLPLSISFGILGEAFELGSWTVGNIPDQYHFMWDVLDELSAPKAKEDNEN